MNRLATLIATTAVAAAVATPATAQTVAPCRDQDTPVHQLTILKAQAATLCLVNQQRVANHRGVLRKQLRLRNAANQYAAKMVRGHFFDHFTPTGQTPEQRLKKIGYLKPSDVRYAIGENIAWGTDETATPASIVASWMMSPKHRKNILTKRYREAGVGIALGAPVAGMGDLNSATYVMEFGDRGR